MPVTKRQENRMDGWIWGVRGLTRARACVMHAGTAKLPLPLFFPFSFLVYSSILAARHFSQGTRSEPLGSAAELPQILWNVG